ncbi:NUDIX domain-containing protein [Candidatus Kaiserbacteria bacterium]|nr:NUDIX domain-containing protein [Candidatus Kaiserbacteria bacterium]
MVEHVADEDRPRVVATCIIYKWLYQVPVYLITLRNGKPPYADRWQIVGEGFELRKDFPSSGAGDGCPGVAESVARRGVEEEVGLQVGRLHYLGSFGFIRPHDTVPVFGMRFVARRTAGIVKLDDESTEHRWVTADELHDYNLIGSIADDIRAVDRMLKRRQRRRRRKSA